MWTFGKKIGFGFAVSFVLMLLIGVVAHRSIDTLTTTSYSVAHTHNVLERIAHLMSRLTDAETGQRGFVLTGDEAYLAPYSEAGVAIPAIFDELRQLTADNDTQQQRLAAMQSLVTAKMSELKHTIDLRRQAGFEPALKVVRAGEGKRTMDELRVLVGQMNGEEQALLKQRADQVESASRDARRAIVLGTLACLLFVLGAGIYITRSLTRQIGSAVQQVRSSSAELQVVAKQQESGARESSSSMTEVSTTISELMATSSQIADSARRVAGVAQQTVSAARAGEDTVQVAQTSIAAIRRQVDLVVSHMLDLGKKSQEIGSVLDIVFELAEQTNILSINATIEAADAGESGQRFSVVADEIRKLADRVGVSTKEIRMLIDDVRAAVNSTVMATETGSKAVDEGTRHFDEVSAAFRQIASLVTATTEAAREIELSTQQQASAVAQVNTAISSTAVVTRESAASATQTSQTASQLVNLSQELMRMVQPRVAV